MADLGDVDTLRCDVKSWCAVSNTHSVRRKIEIPERQGAIHSRCRLGVARSKGTTNGGEQRQGLALRRLDGLSAISSLRHHWPEYVMEVGEVACYLFVACMVATLLQHPASIVRQSFSSVLARRAFMGLAMGATAIAIVMSPWGKRSGGHFNPAITLTFYRLGKVRFWDAWLYVVAQFSGAIGGVTLARIALRGALANHAVRYAVTVPGRYGSAVAFAVELAISFILMITVLFTTNRKNSGPVHRVFCRSADCDVLHVRNAGVWDEHEPGTNVWFSTSRQLLACAMALFCSSVARHVGRWRSVSSSRRGRRSLLRQTLPRQPRTLHLPSCQTRSLERRILCNDFKMSTLPPIVA